MFQSHVITNRAMKRLVFLVEHGPKVWNSVIRLCIFQFQFLSSAIQLSLSHNPFFIVHFYNSKGITKIENKVAYIVLSRRFRMD